MLDAIVGLITFTVVAMFFALVGLSFTFIDNQAGRRRH